jgi:hypothetical protein
MYYENWSRSEKVLLGSHISAAVFVFPLGIFWLIRKVVTENTVSKNAETMDNSRLGPCGNGLVYVMMGLTGELQPAEDGRLHCRIFIVALSPSLAEE